jgi:hypothetical protein
MKAGALALPTEGSSLDDSGFPSPREEDGHELLSTLDVEGYLRDLDGFEITTGSVGYQSTTDIRTHTIDHDGNVVVDEDRTDIVTSVTDIVYVPDELLLTESLDDEYAHDVVEGAFNGSINSARINLSAFAESLSDVTFWMEGFYDRDAPVDAGTAFGQIDEDDEIRRILSESEKNQLGVTDLDYNGRNLKIRITESGYVEVYQPNDVDTVEFTQFIEDCVLPYATPK